MKLIRKVGATSQIFQIFVRDSSSTIGAGLAGLTNASGSLTAYYHRDTDTTATAISLVTMTVGTFTSSGFKEIDATNMPGWYQFCPPNAALASGAASVAFHLKGASNMAPLPIEVDLDAQVDVYLWNGTAVASPATAGIPDVNVKNMNNVAATSITTINANVGTTQPTNFTGTAGSALVKSDMVDIAGAAVSTSAAQIGVNAVNIGGTAQTGRDIGASVLLSSGTGTGQVKLSSGYVAPNWGDVGNPTTSVGLTGTTISTSQVIASVSGAVGSVTGAVGSVIGNVGGNVTGSVGSVVGAVGSVTARVTANADQLAGQTITAAAGVTFPTSVASPTNITAGTITTVTNLTNAPTVGDFTSTMKTSLNAATPAVTVSDKTGFSLTSAYDPAKTATQAGDAMTLTSGERTTLAGVIWANASRTLSSFGTLVADVATAVWAAATRTLTAFAFSVSATLSAGERTAIADAMFDETDGIESGLTLRQAQRIQSAASAGKLSGAATSTVTIRNAQADSKNRIVATVDSDGNRTAVTLDVT